MKTQHAFRKLTTRTMIALCGLFLLASTAKSHGTSSTWSFLGNGNWSTGTNWNNLTSPSTAADSATMNALVLGYTVNYDTGATGNLGTLTMANASLTTMVLNLQKSLALTTGGSMAGTLLGGTTQIQLNGNTTFTLNTGSNFMIGANTNTVVGGTYILANSGYTGTGVQVNGNLTFETANTVSNILGLTINAPVSLGAGGAIKVDSEASGGTLAIIAGNFTSSASANTVAATSSNGNATAGALLFQGATVNIGAGTAFSGFSDGTSSLSNGTNGVYFNQTSTGTQTIALGAVTGFGLRNSSSGGTMTALVSTTATANSVANAVDTFTFSSTASGDNTILKLGSNMNFAGGTYTTPFFYSLQNNMTATVDLNGYTYDATAGNAATTFSPTGTTASTSSYVAITNSGTSSLAGGNGVFKAAAFNLGGGADVGVGSGVILQATATGGVNDLGNKDASATTTINSGSTFYYSGSGTATLKSTNNRAVGNVLVGNGTLASTLQLGSTVTVAGTLTPNANATLDLNGNSLVLTGAASLSGSGTYTNSSASSTASITFAAGATGGLAPGGTGTAGSLSFTAATQPLTIKLANSTTTIDLLSPALGAGTYDTINLSNTTLDLTGGAINLNFGAGTYNGSIQLFSLANGATITGSLGSLTSNLGGAEILSLSSTGLLTFAAVPEPSTVILMCGGLLFLGGVCRRARKLSASLL
ncbi:PEP-CTERM protein-sorting domain-containing protein [Verrucomicrobium sp. GAS474]|nr:PEP-CTERM protein-sorting domain-containing protein [Verrucomicrobium sp. GAS474]